MEERKCQEVLGGSQTVPAEQGCGGKRVPALWVGKGNNTRGEGLVSRGPQAGEGEPGFKLVCK